MKLFRSEAKAQVISPPPRTEVHHHPSEVGPILAKAGVAIATPIIAWLIGLFLLNMAGVRHPGQVLAELTFWLIGVAVFLFVADRWFSNFLSRWFEHKEALAEEQTRQLQYRQLMTQSAVTDSRTSGDMQRLASLIYMIMLDAYDDYARQGPYTGAWRPWSRRPAGERVLVTLGETAPVGQDFGSKVRPFLERNEIIVNDQLNLTRYPDLSHVQRLLYQPMLLNKPDQWPPSSPPALPANEWSIID